VSERLVDSVDALVVYRTNPHVDMAARAAESADLLRELLAGERMARAFLRLPLTPPSVTLLTAAGPYHYSCTVAEAAYLVVDDREHRRERRLDGGDARIMGVVAAGCEGSDPTTVHAGACGGLGGPVS
jgi:hypothetical protein